MYVIGYILINFFKNLVEIVIGYCYENKKILVELMM